MEALPVAIPMQAIQPWRKSAEEKPTPAQDEMVLNLKGDVPVYMVCKVAIPVWGYGKQNAV